MRTGRNGAFVGPWLNDTNGTFHIYLNTGSGPGTSMGLALESVDYRRYQDGSIPKEWRLRLPGQYYDEETDLAENWNRFYDASTGRMTSQEPMLQDPLWLKQKSKEGQAVPSYAYAENNPISKSDPTGLFVQKGTCGNWAAAVALAMKWAGCKGGKKGAMNPNNECQYQLASNNACNICWFLEDGIGPDLFVRSLPIGAGKAHTNVAGFYFQPNFHPEANSIVADDGLCTGNPDELAEIMIHEAAHFCATKTKTKVPDSGGYLTRGTGRYFGYTCRSNNGGPICD